MYKISDEELLEARKGTTAAASNAARAARWTARVRKAAEAARSAAWGASTAASAALTASGEEEKQYQVDYLLEKLRSKQCIK